MLGACDHVRRMGMIQIRNVPDDLHRALKAKAAHAGLSLSDYLLKEVRLANDRLTMREWLDRVKALTPIESGENAADIIREMRGPLGPG